MEGLIIAIVIGILAKLFTKNDSKEKKAMPPIGGGNNSTNHQQRRSNTQTKTFTSLEDFAKEIFQEINGEKQVKVEIPPKPKVEQMVVKLKEEPITQSTVIENANNENRQLKMVVEQEKVKDKQQTELPKYVPTSKEALLQAVIYSEILGPPMAKRR